MIRQKREMLLDGSQLKRAPTSLRPSTVSLTGSWLSFNVGFGAVVVKSSVTNIISP
jgi:hypothetical protein